MKKFDKLKMISGLKIVSDWEVSQDKVIDVIKNMNREDIIIFGTELYKYNERGWKNKRKIFLTYQGIYNTDSRSVKSYINYSDIECTFEDETNKKLVIICNKESKVRGYYFLFWQDEKEFFRYLHIMAKLKNQNYCTHLSSGAPIDKLFYENNPKQMINDFQIKNIIFDKKLFDFIVYQIDFESFIKKEIKKSDTIYIDVKQHIVLENYEIRKLLSNKENWFVFLIENTSTDSFLILKVLKKWTVINTYIENHLYYMEVFSKYENKFGMVDILYICESNSFLMMAVDYHKFNNIYNYIYPLRKEEDGKCLFDEESLFYIFNEILIILKKVHDEGKTLLSLQPENIYFTDERKIKISHLTINKLNQALFKKKKIQLNIEYSYPNLLNNKTITQDIDFWHLGILLYECLYGVTPFQQDNDIDTKNMILVSEVYFPSDEIKMVSKECKNTIIFLLNKDEDIRKDMTVDKIRELDWYKIKSNFIHNFDLSFTDKTNKIGYKKKTNFCREKVLF